ncbi:MAG: cytidine deaminase [Rhodoblastus sp.]
MMKKTDDLFAAAAAAHAHAHAPYSGFAVGAAVRGASGRIYAGCNVENAAYPEGLCAEANAIGACVTAGETQIVEALVIADTSAPTTPCGACRQRLREFSADDTPVHVANIDGVLATYSLGSLLPHSFGPGHISRKPSP